MSQKSSLFGRYVNFNSFQANPQVTGSTQTNPLIGRNAVLGHTYLITSKIVNEARVGWNEFYNIGLGVEATPGKNWAAAKVSPTSPRRRAPDNMDAQPSASRTSPTQQTSAATPPAIRAVTKTS